MILASEAGAPMAADLQPIGIGADVVGVVMVHDDSHNTLRLRADSISRRAGAPLAAIPAMRINDSNHGGPVISNFGGIPGKLVLNPNIRHRPRVYPNAALDAIDRKILGHLQTDMHDHAELADGVGLSVSPCRRVKLLERGVISPCRHRRPEGAGLHVNVFISIKLARQKEEDLSSFAHAISKWDEVLELTT
jgi:hypothetical protein